MKSPSLKLRTLLAVVALLALLSAILVRTTACSNPQVRAWRGWIADLKAKAQGERTKEIQERAQGNLAVAAGHAGKAEILEGRLTNARKSLSDSERTCDLCRWCAIKYAIFGPGPSP